MHYFDMWGWYVSAPTPGRSTDIAPPITSESTVPGGDRANFTGIPGAEWEVRPYVVPVITAPSPVVPPSVTMRQARLALLGAGLLASVNAVIEAMGEPTRSAAQIEWEYSNELQRGNALVAALGPALGLTESEIDQLFITAATL